MLPPGGNAVARRNIEPRIRTASTVAIERRYQAFEARIHQLIRYDSLTGLPNLEYVDELMEDAIGSARARSAGFAVALINIDDFRLVDEAFGRAIGDELLRNITLALTQFVGDQDALARVGADEFLLILSKVTDSVEAAAIAQRVLESIARAWKVGGQDVQITASAGIAFYPAHGEGFERLLRNATAAMHESKARGHGGWKIHAGEGNVEERARTHLRLTTSLRSAIEQNELSVHYQPQYETATGRNCGVEALARWFCPNGEVIGPAVFTRHAEHTGLIGALGSWVLQEACAMVGGWHRPGERPPILCVNVSAHQIRHEFLAILSRTLERTGFPAAQLELEITESILIADAETALACLSDWKRLGVRIAVDDFGTGFSSLSYLSLLPVDRLKVDKSLIQRMTVDRKTAAIVRAVLSLGKNLGFSVLAEGVETEEQLKLLIDMGCEQVQGYLLTPPTCPTEARSLLARSWGLRRPVLPLARKAVRRCHAN